MKPTLTLIRGIPGSGKSTLAATLPAIHLEADMYFVNEQGEYCYQPSLIQQAHAWCQSQTRNALKLGKDVAVSNTFIRLWEMKAYIALAKRYNAQLEIIECKGDFGSVHDIDATKIEQMKQNWQPWDNRVTARLKPANSE